MSLSSGAQSGAPGGASGALRPGSELTLADAGCPDGTGLVFVSPSVHLAAATLHCQRLYIPRSRLLSGRAALARAVNDHRHIFTLHKVLRRVRPHIARPGIPDVERGTVLCLPRCVPVHCDANRPLCL
ncbi:unnamed protein product [Pleuronectes platessa]|uniref:Uncharacterized protein n=1 Tax=Pleuronectes platessa TaxID=8262 RepID=A0A9N7UVW0_PLEPL|nr:unnamed protein product [Pleuronectes platessa]